MVRNFMFAFLCLILALLLFGTALDYVVLQNFYSDQKNQVFIATLFAIFSLAFFYGMLEKYYEDSKEDFSLDGETFAGELPLTQIETAETAFVNILFKFQKEGRLLDFVMNDISAYSDDQVGKVARIVHQGIKEVLSSSATIAPLHPLSEGDSVIVDDKTDFSSHKILGNDTENLPMEGKLVHRGWKASNINVPTSVSLNKISNDYVIQAAEIEIK